MGLFKIIPIHRQTQMPSADCGPLLEPHAIPFDRLRKAEAERDEALLRSLPPGLRVVEIVRRFFAAERPTFKKVDAKSVALGFGPVSKATYQRQVKKGLIRETS
jgi:hypothetical protein